MSSSAAEIAADLNSAVGDGDLPAFIEGMGPRYAEEIDFAHEPPLPGDGIMKGADLHSMESSMIETVRAIVPDYHHEAFSAEADGDRLIVRETRVGTLPDGTVSRVPATGEFTVVDGKFTAAVLHINMEDLASFMAAMSAAGVSAPTSD